MSVNNDEVLDNWEEIDDVGLNSTLDKLKKETTTTNMNHNPISQHNGNKPMKMLLMNDDDFRTQYGPSEPTVKILKRPTHNSGSKSNVDIKPKAPPKTLAEREREYAQARLRIMGSAKNSDDIEENGIIFNSIRSPSISSNANTSDLEESAMQPTVRPQDGIIRLPRGPNGTAGFMIKR